MQLRYTILILTIFFQLLFVPSLTDAKSFQENPLTKAILMFDKEKFAEAEILFKKLLDERPDDFMVNYFYGACRTENGHYTDQDLNYLIKASKEVTPLNIDYYFAVQYHAKNQWEKALAHYKLYKTVAGANEQEKVKLSLKMDQCANKVNPFISSEKVEKTDKTEAPAVTVETGATAVTVKTVRNANEHPQVVHPIPVESENSGKGESKAETAEKMISPKNDTSAIFNAPIQNNEPEQLEEITPKAEIAQPKPADEQIKFNINDEITYLFVYNFKTAEGKNYFNEGNLKHTELNEIVKKTETLREKYKTTQLRSEKDSIGQQILALESQTYELRNVANQLFSQAKTVENGYWQNAPPEETKKFIRELNAATAEMDKAVTKAEPIAEFQGLIIPPVAGKNEPEKSITKSKPSGIVYKIQLGAYSRGIPNNLKPVFSKISVLRKVENYTDEKGVVVYTTGNLTSYDDAVVMQNQIKQEGIKDPIIAAYLNGKRITLEQAKEIEKRK